MCLSMAKRIFKFSSWFKNTKLSILDISHKSQLIWLINLCKKILSNVWVQESPAQVSITNLCSSMNSSKELTSTNWAKLLLQFPMKNSNKLSLHSKRMTKRRRGRKSLQYKTSKIIRVTTKNWTLNKTMISLPKNLKKTIHRNCYNHLPLNLRKSWVLCVRKEVNSVMTCSRWWSRQGLFTKRRVWLRVTLS